jgi:predicted TIM-barrel fold metal-dependent hydrolase
MIPRRRFLQLSLATFLTSCIVRDDYTQEDATRLREQMAREAERSGKGPFGPLRFEGYRGLAELPYFELREDGLLKAVVDLPEVIDMHTHLGWSYFLAPEIDLQKRNSYTHYLLDCDMQKPPCKLDLDVYVNANFDEDSHARLKRETISSLLFGSNAAATHTIPNLLAEMDAARISQAAVLPIATNLPFSADQTELTLKNIASAGASRRLIPFGSVHPGDPGAIERLRDYAKAGVRGIKLHPEMQRFFPDDAAAMKVYEECGRLGLPVIFHAGRSGIEPDFMRRYALIRRYIPPVREFPQVRFLFGHAGARDVAEAIPIAQRHDNVWMELSSQGATQIHELIQQVGVGKLLFGSDWPFYPQAVALAKILLVTEKDLPARAAILAGNARTVLSPQA